MLCRNECCVAKLINQVEAVMLVLTSVSILSIMSHCVQHNLR